MTLQTCLSKIPRDFLVGSRFQRMFWHWDSTSDSAAGCGVSIRTWILGMFCLERINSRTGSIWLSEPHPASISLIPQSQGGKGFRGGLVNSWPFTCLPSQQDHQPACLDPCPPSTSLPGTPFTQPLSYTWAPLRARENPMALIQCPHPVVSQ